MASHEAPIVKKKRKKKEERMITKFEVSSSRIKGLRFLYFAFFFKKFALLTFVPQLPSFETVDIGFTSQWEYMFMGLQD